MGVYTKTGDDGTTALIGGQRVPKYDVRVEAYGTVDELSAHTALLCDMLRERTPDSPHIAPLCDILQILMSVETALAAGEGAQTKVADIPQQSIELLERQIDEMSARLPKIANFTIAGGDNLVSQCHICRTVCRRAERRAVEALPLLPNARNAVKYLNRLSDWLYVLGRTLVKTYDVKEILWKGPQKF